METDTYKNILIPRK